MTTIKKWRTLDKETLIETPIFEVNRVRRAHPDTHIESNFWQIAPPDWANIVALTDDDDIVLVRQYRHGTDTITLEIPGGAIDEGEGVHEGAERELREETGFTCESWHVIGTIDPNPAFMSNRCVTLLGLGAKRTTETSFDEHEELYVELHPVEAFFSMIDDGTIRHGVVVAAAYYLRCWREEKASR